MKKLIALLFAGAIVVGGAFSASADHVDTEIGSAHTGDGYTLLLDGNDDVNPYPVGGYAGVDADGGVQCGDAGDGYEYADNNGDGDTDDPGEKTASDEDCHPENQLPQE